MDLMKMREFDWVAQVQATITKYNKQISYPDQDVINIIFHDNPGASTTL